MLSLHSLPSTHGRKRRRVGRGSGSGRGTYAGRGIKGQRSRSGGRSGLKNRALKKIMLSIPKARGFTSPHPRMQVVNLRKLEKAFEAGAIVNPQELLKHKLIQELKTPIKILGTGTLTKKLNVTVHAASDSAKNAIIKAGGTFEPIKKNKK